MSARGATATSSAASDLLRHGEVTVKGRMPWSSNATFLVELILNGTTGQAVYKPGRGERPLWDFPPALYRREVAAYLLSEALGWGLVPLTIEREGPFGDGSLQQFVPADFEQHYFTLREDRAHHARLKQICLFDLLTNNADRKSGHCLLCEGTIYAIDNGLTFHEDPKLRTVIWDFGGEPIPAPWLADVERVIAAVPAELRALLDASERRALLKRARTLIDSGRFPTDSSGQRYPWPLV
jgi:uncharacterized repeat protein (TIGR03843 family)